MREHYRPLISPYIVLQYKYLNIFSDATTIKEFEDEEKERERSLIGGHKKRKVIDVELEAVNISE